MNIDRRPCKYCGSEIPASASICPVCKYHQASWRNTIIFLAGLTGFIAILGSALTFIVDRSVVLYKNIVWKDEVNLLYLRTGLFPKFAVTLSNGGDGPIFLADITIYWREHNVQYNMNRALLPNEVTSIGDGNLDTLSQKYDYYVSSTDGVPTDEVVKNSDLAEESEIDSACFLRSFFNENNSDVERMNTHFRLYNNIIVSEPAVAYLSYYSLHARQKIKQHFPLMSTFIRLADARCANIPWDSKGAIDLGPPSAHRWRPKIGTSAPH